MSLTVREAMGAVSYDRYHGAHASEIAKLEALLGIHVISGPFRGMILSDDAICSERLPKLVGA